MGLNAYKDDYKCNYHSIIIQPPPHLVCPFDPCVDCILDIHHRHRPHQ